MADVDKVSVTKTGVDAAKAAMREIFPETPLQLNEHLSRRYGAEIWLKREDLSPVRSYKIRGAFNFLRKAIATGASGKTFVCASAGNHAQGFAFVCRHFGVPGVVFMPVTTPQQKIDKTRMFGGGLVTIKLIGDIFDQCYAAARAYVEEIGGVMVPPFDDPDIIEGQATVAAELVEQLPEGVSPDLVIMPVGGGGLSSGLTGYLADRLAPEAFPVHRTGRRAEPEAEPGGRKPGHFETGRQFRRRCGRRPHRRPEFRGAQGFFGRAGSAPAGKRHLRDDHRNAQRRRCRAGAGGRVVDHRAGGTRR